MCGWGGKNRKHDKAEIKKTVTARLCIHSDKRNVVCGNVTLTTVH